MKKVKIITDSASDISSEMVEKLDICMLPLVISFGDEQYLDYYDLSPDKFLKFVKSKKEHPKTSMVPINKIQDAIEKYSKEYDEVLYITLSKAISGTYQGAKLALKNVIGKTGKDNITIYDSNTFSVGQAMMVKLASEMAALKSNVSNIVEKLNEMKNRQRCLFVLDDLSFVKAGGRISSAQALVGTILDIKPIFEIDSFGKPSVISKARGLNRTMSKIKDLIAKDVKDKLNEVWYIHCDGQNFINKLESIIDEHFEPAKSYLCKARGCIGTHGGPGLFGIAYLI